MWYKRYGYKQPTSNGREIGCLFVIGIPLISFIISFAIAVYYKNHWLLLIVVPLSIASFEVVDRYVNNERERFREARRKKHLRSAIENMDAGGVDKALASIRRAKIYGELPNELKTYEQEHIERKNTLSKCTDNP